jgi:uncharacterized protein YoxC
MTHQPHSKIEDAAFTATRWVGSIPSLIIHTVLFAGSFLAVAGGLIGFEKMLLVVTTLVSLEAIYLAIFIQMSVNRQGMSLEEVEHDIDEMQEDVGEIQEDIDEIQKDVDEMQEDVEEMSEEDKRERKEATNAASLEEIRARLERLLVDIEKLQANK